MKGMLLKDLLRNQSDIFQAKMSEFSENIPPQEKSIFITKESNNPITPMTMGN
jgi:hypothetical protein